MTLDALLTGILQREDARFVPGMKGLGTLLIDRPADRGGPTLVGATWRTFGQWKWGRPATVEELRGVIEPELRQFYIQEYVTPFSFTAEPLRLLLIDWSVTSGVRPPVEALQAVLRARHLYDGAVDGLVGPATRSAVAHDTDAHATYVAVLKAREDFYVRLALHDPPLLAFLDQHPSLQLHNLAGWLHRCQEFVL